MPGVDSDHPSAMTQNHYTSKYLKKGSSCLVYSQLSYALYRLELLSNCQNFLFLLTNPQAIGGFIELLKITVFVSDRCTYTATRQCANPEESFGLENDGFKPSWRMQRTSTNLQNAWMPSRLKLIPPRRKTFYRSPSLATPSTHSCSIDIFALGSLAVGLKTGAPSKLGLACVRQGASAKCSSASDSSSASCGC